MKSFNFGFESQGIKQLQIELKNIGIYTSSVDGIVGGQTMSAVAQFQKKVGLEASGHLTAKTRYYLSKTVL